MPDSNNPMTSGQRHEAHPGPHTLACKDVGQVDCGFEAMAESPDDVRDAMMRHYMDEHPGHKVDDALQIALSERYRM